MLKIKKRNIPTEDNAIVLAPKKLLEENIGKTLFDINCSKIFLDPPPRVMRIKTEINI